MDPAIVEIANLYYQGSYDACLRQARASAVAGIAEDVSRTQLVYGARAVLAGGRPEEAEAILGDRAAAAAYPDALSTILLADYQLTARRLGAENAVSQLDDLLALCERTAEPGPAAETVRYNTALALLEHGSAQQALEVLGVTGACVSQELECVALGVHILLSIHRLDLAEKEYVAARSWSDDSLLTQLMEAWIGLVRGGRATQQAFYVYDELSQSSNVANLPEMVPSLVGKSVSSAALGDTRRSLETLQEAQNLDPHSAAVTANEAVVLALGKDTSTDEVESAEARLRTVAPQHPLLADWEAKRQELEQAIAAAV